MSPEALRRVRESYASFAPRMPELTAAFYRRLFARRPDLRPLFRDDLTLQERHLAASLELIALNLAMLDALEEPLRQLGADHARAGVRAADYPPVVETLLEVIGEALAGVPASSDASRAESAADWRRLLEAVGRHMLAGATRVEPDRPAARP
ncbi:MAG: Globin-like protein [Phycisphaerales bacterium]|nr:Globin-like protein [Phycisphaerales bacterium]